MPRQNGGDLLAEREAMKHLRLALEWLEDHENALPGKLTARAIEALEHPAGGPSSRHLNH